MTKTVNATTPGPFTNGSPVLYDLTVYNQSPTVDVFNVTLSDYFPECLVLNDPTWTETVSATSAANGIATLNSPIALIPANEFQTVTIEFVVSPSCLSGPITNDSEITGYDDDNDPSTPPAPDEDSTPGDDYGNPSEIASDNQVDDDNPNAPGGSDDPADSDDYDPEEIEFFACESIAGDIFYDLNADGCQDGTESLVMEAITISLYECGDVPGTDLPTALTTITDGDYEFGPNSQDVGADLCLDNMTEYLSLIHI